jgi:hypothetical protein
MIEEGALRDSDECTAAEKLLAFLLITTQGISYRLARELLQHSLRTIHNAFHNCLDILSTRFYRKMVNLPQDEVPEAIPSDSRRTPFFDGCCGAIDGTHIPISLPRGVKGDLQVPWRNRKGWLSQNVLVTTCCH